MRTHQGELSEPPASTAAAATGAVQTGSRKQADGPAGISGPSPPQCVRSETTRWATPGTGFGETGGRDGELLLISFRLK